jgi:hypothetical protein
MKGWKPREFALNSDVGELEERNEVVGTKIFTRKRIMEKLL